MRVDYYLNVHEDVMFAKVRMDAYGLLHGTQHMNVYAQLLFSWPLLLYTIRDSTDHWQHSNEIISMCFKNILEVICP